MFKDEVFLRGKREDERIIPMTKYEIRVLTICYLELEPGMSVLDIGAGTGSLTCEIKNQIGDGTVLAVEREREACSLIEKNAEKLGLKVDIAFGEAGEVLEHLERKFDRIFVGGSGGDLEEILESCDKLLVDGGILVANFITLGNAAVAVKILEKRNYELTLRQVSINRGVGEEMMLLSNNPVFIVAAKKDVSNYRT